MTTKYAVEAQDALEMIAEAGASIRFLADQWNGGSIATDVIGTAVEIPGDPDTYRALGLIESNPATLIVAGKGLTIRPKAGVTFQWAGRPYTIKAADPVAPEGAQDDGTGVILWTLIGAS